MAGVQLSAPLPISLSELQLVASALRSCHAGIQIRLDLVPSSGISNMEAHMENGVSNTTLRCKIGLRICRLGYKI